MKKDKTGWIELTIDEYLKLGYSHKEQLEVLEDNRIEANKHFFKIYQLGVIIAMFGIAAKDLFFMIVGVALIFEKMYMARKFRKQDIKDRNKAVQHFFKNKKQRGKK